MVNEIQHWKLKTEISRRKNWEIKRVKRKAQFTRSDLSDRFGPNVLTVSAEIKIGLIKQIFQIGPTFFPRDTNKTKKSGCFVYLL